MYDSKLILISTPSENNDRYGVDNTFYCFFLFIIIMKCFSTPDAITSIMFYIKLY